MMMVVFLLGVGARNVIVLIIMCVRDLWCGARIRVGTTAQRLLYLCGVLMEDGPSFGVASPLCLPSVCTRRLPR